MTNEAPRIAPDPETEFNLFVAFGKTYYGCASLGRLLAVAGQIRDGGAESGYLALYRAAGLPLGGELPVRFHVLS